MMVKNLEARQSVVCFGNGKEFDVTRLQNMQRNVVESLAQGKP